MEIKVLQIQNIRPKHHESVNKNMCVNIIGKINYLNKFHLNGSYTGSCSFLNVYPVIRLLSHLKQWEDWAEEPYCISQSNPYTAVLVADGWAVGLAGKCWEGCKIRNEIQLNEICLYNKGSAGHHHSGYLTDFSFLGNVADCRSSQCYAGWISSLHSPANLLFSVYFENWKEAQISSVCANSKKHMENAEEN